MKYRLNENKELVRVDEGTDDLAMKLIDDVFSDSLKGFKGVNSSSMLVKTFEKCAKYINDAFKRYGLPIEYDSKDKYFRRKISEILVRDYPRNVMSDDVIKELKKYVKIPNTMK